MRPPEFISSTANPLLKEVRKAVHRGGLTDSGWCVAETLHLLEEALRSGCRVPAVIVAENVRPAVEMCVDDHQNIRVVVVPDKLLDVSSQGVVALVEPPAVKQMLGQQPLMLILDGVQDPGNLGTILRSAEAFGATELLLLKGTVNAFNSKVVRSSAGSIFRVPFLQSLDAARVLAEVRQKGATLYAAMPKGAHSPAAVDLTHPSAIVIGSEGRGVGASLLSAAAKLTIPTMGVESLNAAVSAAVLLYEARRQRTPA